VPINITRKILHQKKKIKIYYSKLKNFLTLQFIQILDRLLKKKNV